MTEVWKNTPSWPGYQASSLGRIRRVMVRGNAHPPRILTGTIYKSGYRMVQTSWGGVKEGVSVHCLVCEAFHGPKRPEAPIVRHLDNDKLNNVPENLTWGTYIENAADRKVHLTELYGSRNANAKLVEEDVIAIFRLSARGLRGHEIAPLFGLNRNTVNKILNRSAWPHVAISDETLAQTRLRYIGRGGTTGLTDEGRLRHG